MFGGINMKKISAIFLLSMLVFCGTASARTTYDSNGKIIFDNTIRGQKRAAAEKIQAKRVSGVAAAAKINYSASNNENKNLMQSNYYQDKVKPQDDLNKPLENEVPMKSNYYQDRIKK